MLLDAVDWAVANPPAFTRDAAVATVQEREGRRPLTEPLCADGVPEVDRAAVAEFGLAVATSRRPRKPLIADALELAYRLPTLWTRTIAGEVKPWRARQIAQATRPLGRLAALGSWIASSHPSRTVPGPGCWNSWSKPRSPGSSPNSPSTQPQHGPKDDSSPSTWTRPRSPGSPRWPEPSTYPTPWT